MAHQYAPVVEPGGRIVTRRWPDRRRTPVVGRTSARRSARSNGPNAGARPDDLVAEPHGARRRSRRRTGRSPRTRRTVERDGDELRRDRPLRRDDPVVRLAVRAGRCGRSLRTARPSGSQSRGGRRPTGSTRARLLRARPARRGVDVVRRSSTRCSPRRSTSPPTTSASTTPAQASPAWSCASASSSPLPLAVLADRIGRRRMIVSPAWLGAAVCRCSARSPRPSASSSPPRRVGRPLGLALGLPGRRRRRRGDAAQQPGLRRQRAGDGQRASAPASP